MHPRNLICLLITVLLTACAEAPRQGNLAALDNAQQAIATAKADQQVQSYTAAELQRAEDTLQAAQAAWSEEHDQAKAGHLAYLAQRHAEIAQAQAAEQAAVAQSRQIMQERDALRLEISKQQVKAQQRQIEVLKDQLAELKPRQTIQGVVLTLGNVLFAFDSAKLKPAAQEPLDKLAGYLHDHPQVLVQIVGYTDSAGPAAYNQRLSERRAQSIAEAMEQRGINRDRMEVSGRGESNPVATNATEYGRQLNRRVEFILMNQS